ncbi:hypothetical protein [uncultured Methanobacterium sp.]|uniref:hypothetical protein n=1 Tax=uncultured Methanobacterium sp. TaxID=176306 RepID=UPI002AA78577|nr:hypothetical protein [uncultured Methanobacterium sp.]
MTSMCSNPNCSNVKRVEGEVCPECGSPAKDMGFREGTSMIKLKKETMNHRQDEAREITVSEVDNNIDDKVDCEINSGGEKTKKEMVNTSAGINSPILKIMVFIAVVIVFYILFTSLF